jgi:hypothetical protein
MATFEQHNPAKPGDEPPGPAIPAGTGVDPPADGAPAAVAAEFVVHGLLESLRVDTAAANEGRVQRVLEAVGEEVSGASPLVFPARPVRRWALAAVLILAFGAALYFIAIPGSPSARAEVSIAVAALRTPADRRYEVRLEAQGDTPGGGRLGAIVDSCCTGDGAPGKRLIEHFPPWQMDGVFVGRDDQGDWAQRPDGGIEREHPRQFWPPWSVDGESLTVDSLDTLLEQLPRRFTLERDQRAALQSGGRPLDRVTALRMDRAGPYPHRVELWIDPATHEVERVEFRWDAPQGNALQQERAEPFLQPQGPDRAPPAPPDGDHAGPPPRHDHDGGPAPGDHGPPNGHRGGGPGLQLIVFQRVPPPAFPPDWFTPEGHSPH